MVKVSVIVPVFNVEDYLERCLDSLVNQSLKNIEIICVDDGSTDSSPDILKKYSNDSRFTIITQNNQGAAAARNNALKKTRGEYTAFVDGDDWLRSDALEKLYENAKNYNSDIVLFNAYEHTKDETQKRKYLPLYDNYDFSFDYTYNRNLVLNTYQVAWSKLYKTSFLKDNDLGFSDYEIFNDVVFHVKSMLLADKITYLPHFLYNYNRENENSIQSSNKNRSILFDIYTEIEDFLAQMDLSDEFEDNFIRFKITEAEANLKRSPDNFKNEFYSCTRREFKSFDADKDKLSKNLYKFYCDVLEIDNYPEFLKLHPIDRSDRHYLDDIAMVNDQKAICDLTTEYLFVLESDLIEKKRLISLLQSQISEKESELKKLRKSDMKKDAQITSLKDKIRKLKIYKKENDKIKSSRSWKITAPLRKITQLFR